MNVNSKSINLNAVVQSLNYSAASTPENPTEEVCKVFIKSLTTNPRQRYRLEDFGVIKVSRREYRELANSYVLLCKRQKVDTDGKPLFANGMPVYDIGIHSIVHGSKGILGEGLVKKAKYMTDINTGKKYVKSKFKKNSDVKTSMLKALARLKGLPFVTGTQFAKMESYKSHTAYNVILSEFAESDLKQAIKNGLSMDTKIQYAYELLNALKGMHEREVAHRDIKPSNIHIIHGVAHLADLDFATTEFEKGDISGDPAYMAPEVLEGKCNSFKDLLAGDVYQLGVTLYELFNEKHPYDNAIFPKMNINQFETKFPKPTPDTLDHLIWEMKHIDPAKRPAIQDALNRLENFFHN